MKLPSLAGSGGSSGSGSGSGSGGSSGGLITIATSPNQPNALVLAGSTLYWTELQTGIKSIGVTGGTPKVVLSDTSIDQNLATDGTLLYYTRTTGTASSPASEVDAVGLDGTGQKMLATGFIATHNAVGGVGGIISPASQLFVVSGNAILSAVMGNKDTIGSVPTTGGGTLTDLFPSIASPNVTDLVLADASGLYFQSVGLQYAPLAGASALTTLYAPSSGNAGDPSGGELVTSGGAAYFTFRTLGEQEPTKLGTTTLMKATPPSGPASTVGTLAMEPACGLVADATGMYALAYGSGDSTQTGGIGGAIFKVDPSTGTSTLVYGQSDLRRPTP
jgi:hypothetical protein